MLCLARIQKFALLDQTLESMVFSRYLLRNKQTSTYSNLTEEAGPHILGKQYDQIGIRTAKKADT